MGIDIEEISITELLAGQRENQFTAEEIVYTYMQRIAAFDTGDDQLNSVLELNPDAPAIAAGLDTMRKLGEPMGSLHGIPLLLKDNINTGDKLHTSAGSLSLATSYAPDDAFLVKQLREAGAVILGKANMTEWANFMTKGMPNGYSSRGGQVRNPYGKKIDPGGSSSGSGAATAANLCAAAVGTETSGSILSPAIQNMLVGIKPTVGLVSRTGIIPISHSQDTAGPLARSVADAATLLMYMRGIDKTDPITTSSAPYREDDFIKELNKEIGGLRIGVPRKTLWQNLSDAEVQATEETLNSLRELGVEIVDPADFATADEMGESRTMIHEFKSGINAYLASLNSAHHVKTLKDILTFNNKHKKQALKYGQSILLEAEYFSSGRLTDPEYLYHRKNDLRICKTEGIDTLLSEKKLNLLLFPSCSGCAVAARAGYASITIPTGFVTSPKGPEPFGVALTGPAFSEPLLIRCAYALEQKLMARRPPDLTPSHLSPTCLLPY